MTIYVKVSFGQDDLPLRMEKALIYLVKLYGGDAKKYKEITYTDVLKDNLKVMDMAAIAVARENELPIKVFSIKQRGNFAKVIKNHVSGCCRNIQYCVTYAAAIIILHRHDAHGFIMKADE